MARKRYGINEARIKRFIKEGRGTGIGKDYKPWHKVSDVPSIGRVHRPFGNKANREHHLLSDNEYYAFLLFEWNDKVVDIREQFPLDRKETLEIAALEGVKHPIDPFSGALWVLTTDFLLTVRTPNGLQLEAWSVKEEDAINNEKTGMRTIEKLEIEKRYWERRNVTWQIVTNTLLKNQFTQNLDWIFNREARINNVNELSIIDALVYRELLKIKRSDPYVPIKLACRRIDKQQHYLQSESLAALRRLLWGKSIRANLSAPHIQDMPIGDFVFTKGGTV